MITEPKEVAETRAAAALPLFDVQAYVDDFNRGIVPAYGRGTADASLPADAGVARSIIPPGTASVRDFSHLAPQIPELIADRCVGCMTCVNACPDSAILGVALPTSQLDGLVTGFAASQPQPELVVARQTRAMRHDVPQTSPRRRATSRRSSGSSSIRCTARGARNASRSATRSVTTPCR